MSTKKQTVAQLRQQIKDLERQNTELIGRSVLAESDRWTDPAPSTTHYSAGWLDAKIDGLCTILEATKDDHWATIHGALGRRVAVILRDWLKRRDRENGGGYEGAEWENKARYSVADGKADA